MFKTNFFICLPIGIGVVLGIFVASKLIAYLFDKFPTGSVFVVLGFVLAFIFCILYKTSWKLSPLMIMLGVLAFIIGFVVTYLMDYFSNKKEDDFKLISEEKEKAN